MSTPTFIVSFSALATLVDTTAMLIPPFLLVSINIYSAAKLCARF